MNPDYELYSEKESGGGFYERLKLMEISRRDLALKMEECKITENSDEEEEEEELDEEEEEDEQEKEEEFSFAFAGDDAAAIAAEEAFSNGQIKAVYPLFDQSLLYASDDESAPIHLPMRPPVKKVFVETMEEPHGAAASSSPENSDIAGPYCEWSSRKAVEVSPEAPKKSNSTGFSKIWRLKEITCRSNSDGRDAFVFLNGSHAPPLPVVEKVVEKEAVLKKVVKRSVKGKTAAVSPHEVYLKSKAKEEERRRSYLPYRPELMGFFTSTNGGLTRNVHPY